MGRISLLANAIWFCLLTQVDDYGFISGDPIDLAGWNIFRMKSLNEKDIEKGLCELEAVNLIIFHNVIDDGEKKRFIEIYKWFPFNEPPPSRPPRRSLLRELVMAQKNQPKTESPTMPLLDMKKRREKPKPAPKAEAKPEPEAPVKTDPLIAAILSHTVFQGKDVKQDYANHVWADNCRKAFPAVANEMTVAKAATFILANPTKAKRNIKRYLSNWFGRDQDSYRGPATGAPTAKPPDEFERNYTDPKRARDLARQIREAELSRATRPYEMESLKTKLRALEIPR